MFIFSFQERVKSELRPGLQLSLQFTVSAKTPFSRMRSDTTSSKKHLTFCSFYSDLLCGHLLHLSAVVWEPNQEEEDSSESPMGSYERVHGTAYFKGRWDLQRAQSQARSGLSVRTHFRYQV